MTNDEHNSGDTVEGDRWSTSGRRIGDGVAARSERTVADGGFDAEFLERVVEEVGVGVGVYDETGRFRYVNDAYAALLDRDVADLRGSPIWSVNPSIDESKFRQYWNSFDPGETRKTETVHRRSDESEFPVETHTTAVEAGDTVYHVGTITDISERVEHWREVERQDERLERFASVVSHDLRNPLNVAMGRLQLLAEESESDHVEPIERSLERMEELIDGVLTMARQGSRLTDPEPTSLREAVVTSWATTENGTASLEVEDDLGVVRSDESRLCEVFENLFGNAVEHGGSDVTVRVGRLDDGSGFYVEDDGVGIDSAIRDEVFDYGYSTDTGGTGFGLFIVDQIAEAHGWTVELTDGADGGARLEFRNVEIE